MIRSKGQSNDAAKAIVEFRRFAREKGLSAGVQETLGALGAAAALGVGNWWDEDLKFGLRSMLCSSKEDWNLTEESFQRYWRGKGHPSVPEAHDTSPGRAYFEPGPTKPRFTPVDRLR